MIKTVVSDCVGNWVGMGRRSSITSHRSNPSPVSWADRWLEVDGMRSWGRLINHVGKSDRDDRPVLRQSVPILVIAIVSALNIGAIIWAI